MHIHVYTAVQLMKTKPWNWPSYPSTDAMNQENVVLIHNRIQPNQKKDKIDLFGKKSMQS